MAVSPADFSGLTLWLKSDTGTFEDSLFAAPAADDADPIGGWQDQSGNAYHFIQGTAGEQPTLQLNEVNGLPAIRCDGTEWVENLVKANWPFLHDGTSHTIFYVFRITSADPDAAYVIIGNQGTSSANIGMAMYYDDRVAQSRNDNMARQITKGPGSVIGYNAGEDSVDGATTTIVSVRYENGAALDEDRIYINGVLWGSQANKIAPGAGNATFDIQLGAGGNDVAPLVGDIFEVIIYNEALSDTNREHVEDYLADRYALTLTRGYSPPFEYQIIEDTENYDTLGCVFVNDDGELHIIGRRGADHAENTGALRRWVTTSGASWAQSEVLDTVDKDDRNTGGGITRDGTVMLFYRQYDNPTTIAVRILRSTDGGDSFNDIGEVPADGDTGYVPYSLLVQLPQGKILQPCYGFDGTNYRSYVLFSNDDGLTWGDSVDIRNSTTTKTQEPAVCYLEGTSDATSKLLCVFRDGASVMEQARSADGGANWTAQGNLPFSVGVDRDATPWLHSDGTYVYLVWADRTIGQVSYVVSKIGDAYASVDSWSKIVRLQDAIAGPGNEDFGSTIGVIYNGKMHIAYYDERDYPHIYHSLTYLDVDHSPGNLAALQTGVRIVGT